MSIKTWSLAATGAGLVWLAQTATAHAHGGVDPGDNIWAAWNANPTPSLALFLAAFLYINGLSKSPNPSHPVAFWQRLCFFAGLFAIFLALQSPIDPLAEHQLSIHQVQHLLLRMIGPLLVLAGAPLTPMLRGLPLWMRQAFVRPIVRTRWAHRVYGILTNPIVTTVAFLGTLYFWQVPYLHNLAVRNDLVHEFMHMTLLTSGFLFWWLVIDPKPHRSRLHHGLRVLYLGLIVIPNTLLGAGITFNSNLIYDAYYEYPQPFGMAPLTDQQLGGLLLWVVGDMMSIITAGVVMLMWYQKEQQEHDREDQWDPTSG